jgi:hypothetical protein
MRVRIGNLSILAVLLLAACTDSGPTLPRINAAAGSSGPIVTSADPDNAPQDTTLDVVVNGSGFDRGSSAQWAIAGVPAPKIHTNSTRFLNSRQLVANITIALDADPAFYDVIVTTLGGKKGIGTELFAVRVKGSAVGQQVPDPQISFTKSFGIWVMNAGGTKLFEVAPDSWAGGPWPASSWAPTGTGTPSDPYRLAFDADRERSGTAWPIGIVDIDTTGGVVTGRNLRILATSEPAVHSAWSPLGDVIAAADGAPEGSFPSDLHLVAVDGSGERTIYSAPDSNYVRWPAWSGDGRYVAFVEQPGGGTSRYTNTGDAILALDLTTHTVVLVAQFPPNTFVRDLDFARGRLALAYGTQPYSCSGPPKNCVKKVFVQELDAALHLNGTPTLIGVGWSPSWSSDDGALVFTDGTVKRYDFTLARITNLSSGDFPDWRR